MTNTVPAFHELLNPTLKALHELGGSASINELVEQVIEQEGYPPEVVEKDHGRGNRTELEYRLAWARTYLKKFGLVNNSERGVWSLTKEGSSVEEVDPQEVVQYVRELDKKERESKKTGIDEGQELEDQDDETAPWRETLLETLQTMPPDAFERLCQRLLRESGFIEVEVTGKSGDGGIDGHGIIRIGGLISFPVNFQAKRWANPVGPSTVRDFRGAMVGRAEKGVIITTSTFTRDARAEATRDGAPPIDLIDGDLLLDKLKDLDLGVSTKMVESVEVDVDWFISL